MAQVQGEEIYLSHSGQEVDDNIDEVQVARGTEASLSARLADIVSDFDANQQRQETEIGAVAALGAKNLLKVTASSGVLNTAAIDIADDGSIHISGQPTGNGAYVLSSGIDLVIPENSYILSMGAEAGNTRMSLSLRRKGTTQYVDLYMAESRIIPAGTYDRAHIYLYSDTNYDTTVYPMIRRAEITDDTYVPYAPTNRELYEMILALQSGVSAQSAASLMQAGRIDAAEELTAAEPAAAEAEEEADA